MAVTNSTIGYCHEILLWQCRHRPLSRKKLARGILSYHAMVFRHDKHWDRDSIDSSLCSRKITTLRKLPIHRPKIKTKIYANIIFSESLRLSENSVFIFLLALAKV